jgi:hypothetical protein
MWTSSKRTMGWDATAATGSAGWPMGFLDMKAEIGDLDEGLLGRPIRLS